MYSSKAVQIWQSLASDKRQLIELSDEELNFLWQDSLKEIVEMGPAGRNHLLQTEILRRSANQSSQNVEKLAKWALVVSIIAAIGTIAQILIAICSK